MSKGQLVLATGVNGYLGAHVVDQLVQHGYRVRGTVRSSRFASSKKSFAVYGDAVEIVVADDLVNGIFPELFKGVDAVIHTAQPLPGRAATADVALGVSIEGSLNVFRQAEKAEIKIFSYASSIAAHSVRFVQGDFSKVTEDEWFPITREEVLTKHLNNTWIVYSAEKALSEQAVWQFAEENPHIEMATVSGTFYYGPFAPGQRSPFEGDSFSPNSISTMDLFFGLLQPNGDVPPLFWIDVRDISRALVEGLTTPPTSQVGRKRILVSGEYHHASEIAELVRSERPELAHRVSQNVATTPELNQIIFNERFNEVIHFDLVPWKKTILDAVDTLVDLEEYWRKQGKPILEEQKCRQSGIAQGVDRSKRDNGAY